MKPNTIIGSRHLSIFALSSLLLAGAGLARNSDGSIDEYGRINDGDLQYTEIPGGNSLSVSKPYEWSGGGRQDLEIPENVTLDGILRPVAAIGSRAFDCALNTNNEIHGKLTIPQSVTLIQSFAFRENPLTQVVVADSVKSIGSGAFARCAHLNSVRIPTGVASISESAFEFCTALESVTFHAGVKAIGADAFQGCTSLSSLNLPASLVTIGDSAFEECNSLTEVSLPSALRTIGDSAFANSNSLRTVRVPESVATIGRSAFNPCIKLDQVTFLGDLPGMMDNFQFEPPFGNGDNTSLTRILCLPHVGFEDVFDDASEYQIKYLAPDLRVFAAGGKWIRNNGKGIYLGSAKKDSKGNTVTLLVKNNGVKPLHIRKVRLTGKGKASFGILGGPKSVIPPGTTSKLRIRFQPLVKGDTLATATITSDDPFEAGYRINLSGLGR